MAAVDLAALTARMKVLVYEAATRRGMTVDEWHAWWADPDRRSWAEEEAERQRVAQWPRSRYLVAGVEPPEGV